MRDPRFSRATGPIRRALAGSTISASAIPTTIRRSLATTTPKNPANYSYNGATYHLSTGQTDIGTASSPAFGGLPQISIRTLSSMQFGLNWPESMSVPIGALNFVDTSHVAATTPPFVDRIETEQGDERGHAVC